MPFDLGKFQRLRPFLYHLTARENLPRIRRSRSLECAACLFDAASRPELKRKRRRNGCRLRIDEGTVHVRDQSPLHSGNICPDQDFSFEEFVELLNEHVFFWPGGSDGPNRYGRRHFERYRDDKPALIRIRSEALVSSNYGNTPLFCRYNSGARRCSNGNRSPRGPYTFAAADTFSLTAGKVVEAVYKQQARLPECAQLAFSPDGRWKPLFPVC